MKPFTKTPIPYLLLLCLAGPLHALPATDLPQESRSEKEARMEWWREARFGMFIHWGVYSVLGGTYRGRQVDGIGEWIMHRAAIPVDTYEAYADMFNPVFFDADAWAALAAEAGMRYLVITSKHHDGFALWDSGVSQWDIVDSTPFGRDVLAELAAACRRHQIRLGFYHSIMDWHHPDAQAPHYPVYNSRDQRNPRFPQYLESHLKPQLTELLTGYGDIAVLWFDGEWIPEFTSAMGRELYAHVRNLQPDILVNNRVDKGRAGMSGFDREGQFVGDFGTPEQQIPDQGLPGVDWETCMTLNDTWGWKAADTNWKSTRTLLHNLVEVVSKGGNYLLNVGPTHEGLIPAPSVERLRNIGAWLAVNGESIYAAGASPFPKPSWGRYTQTKEALYAHVFDWPADGVLHVPKAAGGPPWREAVLLATGESLDLDPGSRGTTLFVPVSPPDPAVSVIRLR